MLQGGRVQEGEELQFTPDPDRGEAQEASAVGVGWGERGRCEGLWAERPVPAGVGVRAAAASRACDAPPAVEAGDAAGV